jgi:hypothetical protein
MQWGLVLWAGAAVALACAVAGAPWWTFESHATWLWTLSTVGLARSAIAINASLAVAVALTAWFAWNDGLRRLSVACFCHFTVPAAVFVFMGIAGTALASAAVIVTPRSYSGAHPASGLYLAFVLAAITIARGVAGVRSRRRHTDDVPLMSDSDEPA